MPLFTRSRCDKSDDEYSIASSSHEQHISQNSSPSNDEHVETNPDEKPDSENNGRYLEAMSVHSQQRRECSMGSSTSLETNQPNKGERFDIKLQNVINFIILFQLERLACLIL